MPACIFRSAVSSKRLREECTRARRASDFRRSDDRVPRRARRRAGNLRIRPDLTALGKVIGGGLPVGAFGGRAEIMDRLSPLGPVYQAGTLSGNPLAMAAGWRNCASSSGSMVGGSSRNSARKSNRRRGSTLGKIEVAGDVSSHRLDVLSLLYRGPVIDLASAKRSDLEKFARFFNHCLERGVYFAPSQFETGFLSTAHTPDQIDETARIVREALVRAVLVQARFLSAKSLRPFTFARALH